MSYTWKLWESFIIFGEMTQMQKNLHFEKAKLKSQIWDYTLLSTTQTPTKKACPIESIETKKPNE